MHLLEHHTFCLGFA